MYMYKVHDVSICVYFSIAAIGLFASEEDLSVICVCASCAIVHDRHV